MKNLLIIILIINFVFGQQNCFSDEEVKGIFSGIKELQYKDSLNLKIQENLKIQLKNSEVINKNDSLIIIELETQLKLKDDLIKEVTPKWYENKYLWFGYGVSAILIPIWAIGQIK
jgi:hypothetical protein